MKPMSVTKTYLLTAIALLGLLAITLAVAYVHLGPINTLVAMSISITKAFIIILFFMHVRGSNRLTWIAAATGFFWLLLMIVMTFSDYMMRPSW